MDNERNTYPLTVGKDNTIKQFVERFYIVPRDMDFTEEEKNFREIFLLYIKSDYSSREKWLYSSKKREKINQGASRKN